VNHVHVVPDEPDQVARLERFKAKHPDIAIMTSTRVPTALVGREIATTPHAGFSPKAPTVTAMKDGTVSTS